MLRLNIIYSLWLFLGPILFFLQVGLIYNLVKHKDLLFKVIAIVIYIVLHQAVSYMFSEFNRLLYICFTYGLLMVYVYIIFLYVEDKKESKE